MTRTLLVALSILGSSIAVQPVPVQARQAPAKAMTVGGTVKSVTTESLTISAGGKDMTFRVDGTTKFVAKGLSTKSARNKIMATDAVAVNDSVRVTYHDTSGTLHAASVRVTAKGSVKP